MKDDLHANMLCPILFLDIDGVLNNHCKWISNGYCGIESFCVENLNKIINAVPDCKIIISSAWRYLVLTGEMTIKGFEYMMIVNGVNCMDRIIGVTEADPPESMEWLKKNGCMIREMQIAKMIPGHGKYVVLDDMRLNLENAILVDGDNGLDKSHVEAAVRFLVGVK